MLARLLMRVAGLCHLASERLHRGCQNLQKPISGLMSRSYWCVHREYEWLEEGDR